MKIAPSILTANFAELGNEIQALDKAGADLFHMDIMDGNFVPNLSFGAMVIKDLRMHTTKLFEAHLMVTNPITYVEPLQKAGVQRIIFHYEAEVHSSALINYIKKAGLQVGIALNPSTHESCLEYIIDDLDLVLIMSVSPGWGGQQFMSSQLAKIKNIKENYIKNKNIELEVDGGINTTNASLVKTAGATIAVAGTSTFINNEYAKNIQALKN